LGQPEVVVLEAGVDEVVVLEVGVVVAGVPEFGAPEFGAPALGAPEPGATVAPPNGVTAELEMRNPRPLANVHLMPAVDDAQVKGPRVIDMP
jgi:hypothetical protein